jgi:hypothetical protein
VSTVSPSSTETAVRPEVAAFVEQVRGHLADLGDDEREELTDGLAADLAEQHAPGESLPDPAAYAAELRAAAGLPPAGPRRRPWVGQASTDLHALRSMFLTWVDSGPQVRAVWSVLTALRPAWWVLRAWIAVTMLDQLVGPWEFVTLWPTLGVPLLGPFVLLVAVVVSVLIGQGRLWPGSGPDRPVLTRSILIALNGLAVVVPLTFTGDGSHIATSSLYGQAAPVDRGAMRAGGDVVTNVYAYDASGAPLAGVQLFDQDGRPVGVSPRGDVGRGRDREVVCPWFNGTTPLWNVFPLQQRAQRFGTCATAGEDAPAPAYDQPPLDSVPPVSVAPLTPASEPTTTSP